MRLPLTLDELRIQVRREPGVYWIYVATRSGKPLTLPRLLGRDPSGVLYIGRSKNLRSRLSGLCKGLSSRTRPQTVTHTAVISYWRLRAFRRQFRPTNLWVRIRYFSANDDTYKAEDRALLGYANRYGEAPPLNGALERRTALEMHKRR